MVDEQGNKYNSTYLKRARGLVEHGRARFLSERTICLTSPPYTKEEGIGMSFDNATCMPQQAVNASALTAFDIYEELKAIRIDKDHIFSALSTLEKVPSNDKCEAYGPLDIVGQAKAQAIQAIVACRETTNQKLIMLYEKMYSDIVLSER